MPARYDVIVIGSGLGGLCAAALLARAGRKVLVLERNHSLGGAASTYKVGDLMVEASLHETSDPTNPIDPKHHVLNRIGVLGEVEWVPIGTFYEVCGGPVGDPFVLPDNFQAARAALRKRFPELAAGIDCVLGDMERISMSAGVLSRGRDAFRDAAMTWRALPGLPAIMRGWHQSLSDVLASAFGDHEGVKCALAANISYYHDDPNTMWWLFFAAAQGDFLKSGSCYIRGGSQRLSHAIARAVKAAGGEIVLRRQVSEIRLGRDGRPTGVVHIGRKGNDRVEVQAPSVVGNAAPSSLADMMPATAAETLRHAYAGCAPSTSLFALTLGLSVPPATLGVRAYSTFLLPPWIKRLADFPRTADLFAGMPEGKVPGLVVVDYTSIDCGLGGPPYPVSVVGFDRVANWEGLDSCSYEDKRKRWLDAIVATIDGVFPGIAARVIASAYSTAATMQSYLGTPHGSVYGFAPRAPHRPIWRGFERSPRTPVPGLYLASSYAGSGGFTGAIQAGGAAADCILGDTSE